MILRCENLIPGASLVLDAANTPAVCPCGAALFLDGERFRCARGHVWDRKSGPFVELLRDVAELPVSSRCVCGGLGEHRETCVRERARKMLEGA